MSTGKWKSNSESNRSKSSICGLKNLEKPHSLSIFSVADGLTQVKSWMYRFWFWASLQVVPDIIGLQSWDGVKIIGYCFKKFGKLPKTLTSIKWGLSRPTDSFVTSVRVWEIAAPKLKYPMYLYKFWIAIGTFQLKSLNLRAPSAFSWPLVISTMKIWKKEILWSNWFWSWFILFQYSLGVWTRYFTRESYDSYLTIATFVHLQHFWRL